MELARRCQAAGICILPADRASKKIAVGPDAEPTKGRWGPYRQHHATLAQHEAWIARGADGAALVCGETSCNLEVIDFDNAGELFYKWSLRIPAELMARLAIQRTQSGGYHVVYRCVAGVCGSKKLATGLRDGAVKTLIETRGEGGYFLCAPTPGYELIQGDLAIPPVLSAAERDLLLGAAWQLDEKPAQPAPEPATPPAAPAPALSPTAAPVGQAAYEKPGEDYNARGDVRELLTAHGWVYTGSDGRNERWRRPGKPDGSSATWNGEHFYVFTSSTQFEPNRAYTPFAVYAMLCAGGDYEQAARQLRQLGYGGHEGPQAATGVDISALLATDPDEGDEADTVEASTSCDDPGHLPEELFRVPGFIERVMDFTLANAPYPNLGLAFCGALALQSYLAGRKVCYRGDLMPNIYLLALAASGTGKDYPRKVNARVLFETGQVEALGDKFASGQGIQDALSRCNAMLFQNDEMDGVLRQINQDRENKLESIPNVLMTLYTSAGDIYPVRVKAGQKTSEHIDQPHLTIFGTATPQFFYESLSRRMLTNGFFARLMIVDIGRRGEGQKPGSTRDLPEAVLATARWWADFQPGEGRRNMADFHPKPCVIPATSDAEAAMDDFQRVAERHYAQADERNDEVARVAWSRTHENAMKLALLYACSVDHQGPQITLAAVEWATAFALHQTRRQLFLAQSYVAENPFHAECLKLIRKLREARGGQMRHNQLMRTMRCKLGDFEQIIATLTAQGDIVAVDIPTKTRPARGYRLA